MGLSGVAIWGIEGRGYGLCDVSMGVSRKWVIVKCLPIAKPTPLLAPVTTATLEITPILFLSIVRGELEIGVSCLNLWTFWSTFIY